MWGLQEEKTLTSRSVVHQVSYLMIGVQRGQQTVPVTRVIIDSVESCHVYVGHQPLISAHHGCICVCLDEQKRNRFCLHGPLMLFLCVYSLKKENVLPISLRSQ